MGTATATEPATELDALFYRAHITLSEIDHDLDQAQYYLAAAANHIDNRLGAIPTHSTRCRRPHCRRMTPVGYRYCWPCIEYDDGRRRRDPAMGPWAALLAHLRARTTRTG